MGHSFDVIHVHNNLPLRLPDWPHGRVEHLFGNPYKNFHIKSKFGVIMESNFRIMGIGIGLTIFLLMVFALVWFDSYISYTTAKYNCDSVMGNLTYKGQQRSGMFIVDTWECVKDWEWHSVTQHCYQDGRPINCSEII